MPTAPPSVTLRHWTASEIRRLSQAERDAILTARFNRRLGIVTLEQTEAVASAIALCVGT